MGKLTFHLLRSLVRFLLLHNNNQLANPHFFIMIINCKWQLHYRPMYIIYLVFWVPAGIFVIVLWALNVIKICVMLLRSCRAQKNGVSSSLMLLKTSVHLWQVQTSPMRKAHSGTFGRRVGGRASLSRKILTFLNSFCFLLYVGIFVLNYSDVKKA